MLPLRAAALRSSSHCLARWHSLWHGVIFQPGRARLRRRRGHEKRGSTRQGGARATRLLKMLTAAIRSAIQVETH